MSGDRRQKVGNTPVIEDSQITSIDTAPAQIWRLGQQLTPIDNQEPPWHGRVQGQEWIEPQAVHNRDPGDTKTAQNADHEVDPRCRCRQRARDRV